MQEAEKAAVSKYWVEMVYFTVPMKTAKFGELRNKGFIGFVTKGKAFRYFSKPLSLFEALEQIEEKGGK